MSRALSFGRRGATGRVGVVGGHSCRPAARGVGECTYSNTDYSEEEEEDDEEGEEEEQEDEEEEEVDDEGGVDGRGDGQPDGGEGAS